MGDVQRVPKAEVLPTEQGEDELILLLHAVFRNLFAFTQLPAVSALREPSLGARTE